MLDRELIAMASPTGIAVPVVIEYLDLDHDDVPDAVRIRRAVPGEVADGIEQTRLVEELSTAIGIDGIPGEVLVMALR
jgi:hypothetical protein